MSPIQKLALSTKYNAETVNALSEVLDSMDGNRANVALEILLDIYERPTVLIPNEGSTLSIVKVDYIKDEVIYNKTSVSGRFGKAQNTVHNTNNTYDECKGEYTIPVEVVSVNRKTSYSIVEWNAIVAKDNERFTTENCPGLSN